MARRVFFALVLAIVPLSSMGCSNDKKAAAEGLEKIKEACESNNKDLAKQIAEDLRSKNKIFDKAFGAAVEGNSSPNYCSPLLHNELTNRIEHGS